VCGRQVARGRRLGLRRAGAGLGCLKNGRFVGHCRDAARGPGNSRPSCRPGTLESPLRGLGADNRLSRLSCACSGGWYGEDCVVLEKEALGNGLACTRSRRAAAEGAALPGGRQMLALEASLGGGAVRSYFRRKKSAHRVIHSRVFTSQRRATGGAGDEKLYQLTRRMLRRELEFGPRPRSFPFPNGMSSCIR